MANYYNEIDPFCCQWLRNLIKAGAIPEGDVDERSFIEVAQDDLRGYTQCHFFAGIGGWSHALELAGVPADQPLWTGSCPCQPFSHAGSEKGFADERHLWPAWFNLIRECRPSIVIGEQVEAAIKQNWLDLVFTDLESEGYACGAAVLGAHSAGAPHKRQRLYWAGSLGDANGIRRDERWEAESAALQGESSKREGIEQQQESEQDRQLSGRLEGLGGVGNTDDAGLQGQGRLDEQHGEEGRQGAGLYDSEAGFWANAEWLECKDGCARPVERISVEMADGFPDGLGLVRDGDRCFISPIIYEKKTAVQRLKGYGNAIVPQIAAIFVRSLI